MTERGRTEILSPFRFRCLLIVISVLFAIYRSAASNDFLIGDCPYYAATTRSLVDDGDWDLSNQLGELTPHGFVALGKDERFVPKHSTLMPLLSIPFYLAFGMSGFLVFNLLQIFLLIAGISILAGDSQAARVLALCGYVSTPFLSYTYNYSPDVLGATLVVWSYVSAFGSRPVLCGLLTGLAIWAKIYLAIVLLPLGFLIIPLGARRIALFAATAVVALIPMFLINAHLFGRPWITGYDREFRVVQGGFVLKEHYSRFNQPIIAGLGNLLFDRRIGMLTTAPLWFLWPVGLAMTLRRGERQAHRRHLAMTFSLLLNLLFFARYDEWNASDFGNRFLFPALALGIALQCPLWERLISRRSTPSVAAQ